MKYESLAVYCIVYTRWQSRLPCGLYWFHCVSDDDGVSSKQCAARWISVLLSTEPVESVSSVQCIIKAAVGCAECISATVYWIRVQVYHLSSRVRGVYRSYCVSDQNPPPPQCQPAPVLAHTQGGRDVRWKAGEIFWRENPRNGWKVVIRVTIFLYM